MKVNVDKIDIEKVHDIFNIPQEDRDLYTLLYEEASTPAYDSRGIRRERGSPTVASTSDVIGDFSSSCGEEEDESHEDLEEGSNFSRDFRKNKSKEELLAEERDYKRRRMSYRGKKAQRTPAEVLRDIIEGHMEDIVAAGGIGCIGRRPHDVLLSESETLSSALGKNDNAISWQSGSRDVASKELHSSYHDCSRFSRSKSRDLFRMERGERHRSNSMFLSSSSQRHDQSSRERSESLSYAHSGDKSSDRKYESTRVRRKWESTRHGERQSSKYYSPAHE
ncbi:hypothetical protein L7F22_043469 [Adiantum nelumboides]|nr:hypothetical protein [Adiantum nelumboides]